MLTHVSTWTNTGICNLEIHKSYKNQNFNFPNINIFIRHVLLLNVSIFYVLSMTHEYQVW